MKYDRLQIANIASRIYAAKIQLQPALATDPEIHHKCVTEAVSLIDASFQITNELEPAAPVRKPAVKKPVNKKSGSMFGRKL